MTAGDIAIYREATATDTVTHTSWTDEDYDTTVREDTDTYDIQTGNADIELKETGHYLAMFSEVVDTVAATNQRYMLFGQATYNGSSVNIQGGGYSRNNQGCDEAYVAGSGIFNVSTANQNYSTQTIVKSTGTMTSTSRRADSCSAQLLKLDDDWDYFIATSNTASTIVLLGDDIIWEDIEEEDTDSFDLQANEVDIEVQSGYYLACYTVRVTATSLATGRVGATAYLTLGGTEVEGSRSSTYCRMTQGCGTNIISCICIFESASVENLRLKTANINRVGSGQIIDAETHIQIVKLPDATLKKCWVYDGTGNYDVAGSSYTDLAMDDEIDVDTDVFTHSTIANTDEIEVEEDGDYLFMYGLYYDETAGTANNRYNIIVAWEDGGTAQKYGISGSFFRGYATSSIYITNCGSSHGFIGDALSASDKINLATKRDSTYTSNSPDTTANKSAVSAIQLSSIFPEDEEDVTGSHWFAQQGF
jgi:hypothetical protein